MESTRTGLPEPAALRLSRPRWRDPRLVIGILLVGGSVALGSWAVSAGQQTYGVYAATSALVPGALLGPDDVEVVQVRGPGLAETYVPVGGLAEGAVLQRVVQPGELLPRAALGSPDQAGARPVAVPAGAGLSESVVAGSLVDLWFVPPEGDLPAEPYELAAALVVQEVTVAGSGRLGPVGASVHVLVPQALLGDVLGALSADGVVHLVPVPGGGS